MKLSEAILLGSTVVTPKAGALRFSGENAGCALGMAVVAQGVTFGRGRREWTAAERRTLNIEDVWGKWLLRIAIRPCGCRAPVERNGLRFKGIAAYLRHPRSAALPREMRIKDVIAHLFDEHVMQKRDWTLDRLTSWLQPLEPSEPLEVLPRPAAAVPQGDMLAEAEEWQKVRQAFEAQATAKHRRPVRRPA